ncbi:MAG TPA: hypothetical protein VE569_10440 [Acidimicrobiia bacterium]|jgi:hypothetical protein|nr:hypothetical protein [Acidimicrobiia bacterium]
MTAGEIDLYPASRIGRHARSILTDLTPHRVGGSAHEWQTPIQSGQVTGSELRLIMTNVSAQTVTIAYEVVIQRRQPWT